MDIEFGVPFGDFLKALLVHSLVITFVFIQPVEFRNSGFTIIQLCRGLLGIQHADFIAYQLRRITLTAISHILCIPGFFIILAVISEKTLISAYPSTIIEWLCAASVLIAAGSIGYFVMLCTDKFSHHYVTKSLLRSHGENLETLSRNITREIADPFAIRAVDSDESGIYVLDRWLLRVSQYNLELVKLEDAKFTVVNVIDHPLAAQNDDHQITILRIESLSLTFKAFIIHLQSRNILNLIRAKIGAQFIVPSSISLTSSNTDRFIDTFRAVIMENENMEYEVSTEIENCFGCMAVKPNVKIDKLCDKGECVSCNCRPTWCHSCLARIFASEQDESAPHFWLSGTARCPTCRARFCMLDVRPLQLLFGAQNAGQ